MSKGQRDVRLFLTDILEAVQKIEMYTGKMTYKEFANDEKTKDAVLRNLEVLGEAVKNIPTEIKGKYHDVDWNGAAGMRDKLINEYFGVSFLIVWGTGKNDPPPLKNGIEKILKEI